MKRIYLLAPLLALLVFGAGDWYFAGQLAQEQAALAARAEAARLQAALAAQSRRKQELADQAARDHDDQAARQTALAARDQARDDQARLARQADQLRRDLADEQAALAALQRDQTAALAEQAFLQRFNTQVAANARDLEAVLKKVTPPGAAPEGAK
jgi:hypothetical protein